MHRQLTPCSFPGCGISMVSNKLKLQMLWDEVLGPLAVNSPSDYAVRKCSQPVLEYMHQP